MFGSVRICISEGPEDDSIRIETCCPNTIINIIKFFFVFDTSLCVCVYIYIYVCVSVCVCVLNTLKEISIGHHQVVQILSVE